jgi:hypothetical protein
MDLCATLDFDPAAKSLWERACSRKRRVKKIVAD